MFPLISEFCNEMVHIQNRNFLERNTQTLFVYGQVKYTAKTEVKGINLSVILKFGFRHSHNQPHIFQKK